jgi:hypothetical protein
METTHVQLDAAAMEDDALERTAGALDSFAAMLRDRRETPTVDDLLRLLGECGTLRRLEADLVRSLVGVLRCADTSWVEIGSALELTRQAVWDRYHGVEGEISPSERSLYEAIASHSAQDSPELVEARTYTRVELQRMFGIKDATLKNGVFHMKSRNEIWLFVTAKKQSDRVQYDDRLDGDTLHWQGQTSGRTDARIISHVQDGNDLVLFYRESKNQYPGAAFKLVGRFVYVDHDGPPPSRFRLRHACQVGAS